LKDKDKTVTDTTVKDGGGGGDTTVKDGGGGVGDGDTAIGELTGKDLIELAEDSATLIGPADPSTASLDTGVVSDAGTGFNEGTFRVEVGDAPYLESPSTPQNIRDLVPEGYHLATSEEIDRIQKLQGLNYDADGRIIGPIPENLYKATLLSNGEYAYIAPNITSESLVSDTLPTTVIPSTGQVTGVDLTASEVDTVKPDTAVTSLTGTTTDAVSDITTTAPVIKESATVIRVDPGTGDALVINSTGDIFTVTVDPSTTAGSTVTVPTNTSTTTTAADTIAADTAATTGTTAADTAATTDTTTAADTTAADTTTAAADTTAADTATTDTTTTSDAATTDAGTGTGTGTSTGTGTETNTGTGTFTGTSTDTNTLTGTSADTGVGTGVGTGADVVVGADTGTGTGVGDGTGTTNVSDVSDIDRQILDLISVNPATTDVTEVGDVTTTIDQTPVTDLPVITDTTTDTTTVDETPSTDTSLVDTSTVSDADQEILDLISEELATDTTTDTTTEEEDSGTGTTTDTTTDTTTTTTKPDIFTTTYLSPKKRTTSSTSALGSALGTTGLTASRGAGEIEAPSTGKARKKVWNEESLKLKDALGV
jgi:hypothetical protein